MHTPLATPENQDSKLSKDKEKLTFVYQAKIICKARAGSDLMNVFVSLHIGCATGSVQPKLDVTRAFHLRQLNAKSLHKSIQLSGPITLSVSEQHLREIGASILNWGVNSTTAQTGWQKDEIQPSPEPKNSIAALRIVNQIPPYTRGFTEPGLHALRAVGRHPYYDVMTRLSKQPPG